MAAPKKAAPKKKAEEKVEEAEFLLGLLIDQSYSMTPLTHSTIDGVNTYLDGQQRQPGRTRVTMIEFDTELKVMCSGVDIAEAPRLSPLNYRPDGNTALYDAIAHLIAEIGQQVAMSDRKPHPLLVIMTDGQENSSKEFPLYGGGQERIFNLIHDKQGEGWTVVYLGANQDAMEVGATLGVAAGNTLSYAGTVASNAQTYSTLAGATTSYRRSAVASAGPGGQSISSTDFFSGIGVEGVDEEGNEVTSKMPGPKSKLP